MVENNLLSSVSSKDALYNAWERINKRNPESCGLSGETIRDFQKNVDNKITSIRTRLQNGSFRFRPTRAVVIPKDKEKFRPLQVPEIEDRVVLKSIAILLEDHFSDIIEGSKNISFAYQKGLGIRDAINKMVEHYEHGNKIILEADIINFFGKVNKKKLLDDHIFPYLSDPSINELIISGLNQKVGGLDLLSKGQAYLFKNIDEGIPQGNSLSPLLSNIYLAPFDKFMKANDFRLIRYADDFIVMCSSPEEASKSYKMCKDYLKEKLQLDLYPIEYKSKTNVLDPTKEKFSFLSIEFNGVEYFPSNESYLRFRDKIKSLCNSKANKTDVLNVLIKVKNALDGWISAYYYTDVERYLEKLDYYINRQIFLTLRSFDWRFNTKSIGKIPYKFRFEDQSRDCLSKNQRLYSGIPLSGELLKAKRANEDSIHEEVDPDEFHI